jgi:hypothetical protein
MRPELCADGSATRLLNPQEAPSMPAEGPRLSLRLMSIEPGAPRRRSMPGKPAPPDMRDGPPPPNRGSGRMALAPQLGAPRFSGSLSQ